MISRLLPGIFKVSSNKHVAMPLLFKFRPVPSRHSGVHAILLSFVASKLFKNTAFYSRLLVIDFLSNYPIRLGHLMPIICNIGLLDSPQWLSFTENSIPHDQKQQFSFSNKPLHLSVVKSHSIQLNICFPRAEPTKNNLWPAIDLRRYPYSEVLTLELGKVNTNEFQSGW